jgi:hypothetical protein
MNIYKIISKFGIGIGFKIWDWIWNMKPHIITKYININIKINIKINTNINMFNIDVECVSLKRSAPSWLLKPASIRRPVDCTPQLCVQHRQMVRYKERGQI